MDCEDVGIEVPLSGGRVSIVSKQYEQAVLSVKWSLRKTRHFEYAVNQKLGLLHRWLLGAPPGVWVDHKNGCGLDNRISNIRLCTPSQNSANKKKRASSSRFKGVSKEKNRWVVSIGPRGAHARIGSFRSEEEAARAYNEAATKLYGEFALLNKL